MIVSSELDRMWKENLWPCLIQDSLCLDQDSNRALPERKSESLPLFSDLFNGIL
jgi:hypothetical protein